VPYFPLFPAFSTSSAEAFQSHIHSLSAADSKDAGLKKLQGFLWRTGFETGALKAPLYKDVVPRLTVWKDQGRRLAIFSSGSVEAQHLFLAHTGTVGEEKEVGKASVNTRGLFEGHFDTVNAGPKMEAKSYETIAKELNTDSNNVLFLSDNVKG
jgi:enolase-phosphatase E1